jgi:beta-glucanase (GH16 family)
MPSGICAASLQLLFCSINYHRRILFLFLLSASLQTSAQLTTAHCVHSSGIKYVLDAYLGSIGACNCERTGVYLFDFPPCSEDPYVPDFADDFNGTGLDTSKWQNIPYGQGALQGSQRIDVSRLENVEVKDGVCHIVAKNEKVTTRAVTWKDDNDILEDGLTNLRDYDYSAAILFSKRKFYHGKYEIRCRMPAGNGFWPAFWLFGGERYNEIDIFDNYAGTTEVVTSIGHDYEKGSVSGCNDSKKGYDLMQWHRFTLEWQDDKMVFSVDDETVRVISRVVTASGKVVSCGDEVGQGSYFQLKAWTVEPMNLIFNLVLISEHGPAGSVPVDGSTPFPSSFDVDYIRYWKRSPAELVVFPNPANDIVQISSTAAIKKCVVHDLAGNLLLEKEGTGENMELHLGTCTDGMYLLTVCFEGATRNVKVIKTSY